MCMKFITKKGKSLGIGLAMVGSLLVSSLQAGPVYLHSGESIVSWKLKPEAEVGTNVPALLNAGYDTSSWVDAVVPGTAFTSYVTAGLEKDPNFGDNIHNVDRAKYDRSFWYRTEFKVPADFDKALTWLNFNGVNRKAEIYLNGHLLGILDGFMHRGRFNITEIVKKDQPNVLAVLVHMPQTPLANYGSPTYLSSGGWDWSRTPVPEAEQLAKLAAHGATMVIFLSIGLVDKVRQALLESGGYRPDTPAAVVYKATWPEQKVVRCTVSTLAEETRKNGITKTALIVVGDFLGENYERSKLYDPAFTTEFRQGTEAGQ